MASSATASALFIDSDCLVNALGIHYTIDRVLVTSIAPFMILSSLSRFSVGASLSTETEFIELVTIIYVCAKNALGHFMDGDI